MTKTGRCLTSTMAFAKAKSSPNIASAADRIASHMFVLPSVREPQKSDLRLFSSPYESVRSVDKTVDLPIFDPYRGYSSSMSEILSFY